MTTKLEIAKKKLNRLEKEINEVTTRAKQEFQQIPFGQPNIIGRADIYKNINKLHEKSFKLLDEKEKQENRIETLKMIEQFKNNNELIEDVHVVGSSAYATVGAKTSVNNLEYFKVKLIELETINEDAKLFNKNRDKTNDPKVATYGTKITALKRKIDMLESMKERDENTKIGLHAQRLIDDGLVNQWKKKPIYYFVKGLKKVALEINSSGDFMVSRRYPAHSDGDKKIVLDLIEGNN